MHPEAGFFNRATRVRDSFCCFEGVGSTLSRRSLIPSSFRLVLFSVIQSRISSLNSLNQGEFSVLWFVVILRREFEFIGDLFWSK